VDDRAWLGGRFMAREVKVEHVCDPQPAEPCHVLLNVALGPGVVEEAIQVLSA
jgi:hypothetical protein